MTDTEHSTSTIEIRPNGCEAIRAQKKLRSRYDKALWDAWMAGFDAGWDERGEDNYPIRWILRDMYWGWRRRRRAEAHR